MDHGHETEHHSLIPVGQIVQHFLGFFSLLFHVVRKDSGKVVGCVLLSLPVCRIGFHTQELVLDFPYCFICGNRQNVNGEHEAAVHITELSNHGILDIAGIPL